MASVWNDGYRSCYIRHGAPEWYIYTAMKYNKLSLCVTVPDNISSTFSRYRDKIKELLESKADKVAFTTITALTDYGAQFEATFDVDTLEEEEKTVEEVDAAVVDIMRPLWEKYKDKDNWTLEYGRPMTIVYKKPDMKSLTYGHF